LDRAGFEAYLKVPNNSPGDLRKPDTLVRMVCVLFRGFPDSSLPRSKHPWNFNLSGFETLRLDANDKYSYSKCRGKYLSRIRNCRISHEDHHNIYTAHNVTNFIKQRPS
jgi:hypothetical protein